MQLGDVLDDFSLDVQTSSIEINNVEIDSRLCVPGTPSSHSTARPREAHATG